ncbi:uncharacterized protein BROUX77_002856 [Berkeleyomyces rouxiae]|uniref:uncharacterized protein n=1 Tax=Berkeleyomyces rouxiae TaxID=2035830 RepID=UPI003B7D7039
MTIILSGSWRSKPSKDRGDTLAAKQSEETKPFARYRKSLFGKDQKKRGKHTKKTTNDESLIIQSPKFKEDQQEQPLKVDHDHLGRPLSPTKEVASDVGFTKLNLAAPATVVEFPLVNNCGEAASLTAESSRVSKSRVSATLKSPLKLSSENLGGNLSLQVLPVSISSSPVAHKHKLATKLNHVSPQLIDTIATYVRIAPVPPRPKTSLIARQISSLPSALSQSSRDTSVQSSDNRVFSTLSQSSWASSAHSSGSIVFSTTHGLGSRSTLASFASDITAEEPFESQLAETKTGSQKSTQPSLPIRLSMNSKQNMNLREHGSKLPTIPSVDEIYKSRDLSTMKQPLSSHMSGQHSIMDNPDSVTAVAYKTVLKAIISRKSPSPSLLIDDTNVDTSSTPTSSESDEELDSDYDDVTIRQQDG